MSQFDALMTKLRAGAFKHSAKDLGARAGISDDSVRRLLGEPIPETLLKLKRVEDALDALDAEKQAAA